MPTKRQSANPTSKRYLDRIQNPASLPNPLTSKERTYLMSLDKGEVEEYGYGVTKMATKYNGIWRQIG